MKNPCIEPMQGRIVRVTTLLCIRLAADASSGFALAKEKGKNLGAGAVCLQAPRCRFVGFPAVLFFS